MKVLYIRMNQIDVGKERRLKATIVIESMFGLF